MPPRFDKQVSLGGTAIGASSAPLFPLLPKEIALESEVQMLFNSCGGDAIKLIEVIGKVLRTNGREDVSVHTDAQGTLVSLAQAPQFALNRNRQAAFLSSLDNIIKRSEKDVAMHKERMAAHLPTATTEEEFLKEVKSSIRFGPSDPHRGQPSTLVTCACSAQRLSRLDDSHRPKCFQRPHDDNATYEGYPTSKYNGNYHLRRYGGKFPQHCNYGFYRRYGLKGQGAVTAGAHNYPAGAPPQPDSIYT